MLFNILALISVLICLSLLKRFAAIFPSLMACIIRWKESVNLESSVKHSLDRDMLAIAMVLPFCLVADRFGLYAPAFMSGIDPSIRLALTIGIFIGYILIRTLISKMVRPHKMEPKTYRTAERASFPTNCPTKMASTVL